MSEPQSGCRAKVISTSLVEYTVVLSVLCRPDTSEAAGNNWAQTQDFVSHKMVERIMAFIESGHFEHIDSPIICEDISGAARGIMLHDDTKHCEHSE